MVSRVAAVLTLLVLPCAAVSQDQATTGQEGRTHVVEAGETLGSIARDHLGSSDAWARLFEANRDVVSDPDRIVPGMRLTLPGVAATVEVEGDLPVTGGDAEGVEVIRGGGDRLAEVTGVRLESELTDPETLPEVVVPDDRRELLRGRPFTPDSLPEYAGERTIFHGALGRTSDDPGGPGVVVVDAAAYPAVPRVIHLQASWLASGTESDETLGRIVRFAGDLEGLEARVSLQAFDRVELELRDGVSLAPGDEILAFREVRRIDESPVFAPSGVLEIERVDQGGVVARVTAAFDNIQLGHGLRPMRDFPLEPGVHAAPTSAELNGTLLGFREGKELHLPGDEGFVDLGAADGVAIGDEFVGRVGHGAGREGESVARFQVIRVGDASSTVRLVQNRSPTMVRRGISVVLDRKMP